MALDPWLAWLPVLIVAPCIGSFLGVLIRRLPAQRPVAVARSACEACGRVLAPRELVPIVSYAVQLGRCRTCAAIIAPMHLGVELAALATAALACTILADPATLWLGCVLGWTVVALAWIDAQHGLLPDALTLPLLLAGFAATWLLEPEALTDHALAAALGYGVLRGLAAGYRPLRQRVTSGQGHAKLLRAAGAWIGLAALPRLLLVAAVVTAGWATLLHLRGRHVGGLAALPLGPGIALALWVLWLWQWAAWCGAP